MTPPNAMRDSMNGKGDPAKPIVDREALRRELRAEQLTMSEAELQAHEHLASVRFTEKYVAPLFNIGDALQPQPAIEWAIYELAEMGGVMGLFGAPGSKKTYSVMDLCMCVALGQPWLGRTTKQCKILWVDEDSGRRRFIRRLGDVARGHQATASTPFEVLSLAGVDIREPEDAADLQKLITERGAGIVVFDTLADVCGGAKIISPDEMLPVLQALRRMAEATGALIIFIHHCNKAGDFLGAITIAGKADLLLQIESPPDSPLITFTTEKVRDTGALKFAAQANFYTESGEFWLSEADVDSLERAKRIGKMTGAAKHVYSYLKDNGPACNSDMVDELHSDAAVKQAIARLVDDKVIYRTNPGGKGIKGIYAIAKEGKDG